MPQKQRSPVGNMLFINWDLLKFIRLLGIPMSLPKGGDAEWNEAGGQAGETLSWGGNATLIYCVKCKPLLNNPC